MTRISGQRIWGLLQKEWHQFRRDFTTFAMILILPIVQLTLFGLAINTNPKFLPSILLNYDEGNFSRSLIRGLENTGYFSFSPATSEQSAEDAMVANKALFILTIPSDFSKKIVRGEQPVALLQVDGSDPVSVASALAAGNSLIPTVFREDMKGLLSIKSSTLPPAELRTHVRYNPSGITQYNIIPALMGTILTMTLVMVTGMALTKEREHGTLESLLMTPALPMEVIISKVLPYIVVGYVQVIVILLLAHFGFSVPIVGNIFLLLLIVLPFLLANLFVGMTISSLSTSQLQASQASVFFFLPSMLLSGFAFPFYGMPIWAQWIGYALPLTHFIAIVRGIMLKGMTFLQAWPHIWPILVFMTVAFCVAVKNYRQTLD